LGFLQVSGSWQVLKNYIFWGIFALVLIGIVATILHDRRLRKKREAAERSRLAAASGVARTAADAVVRNSVAIPGDAAVPAAHTVPTAAPDATPVATASAASFDPTATRIYIRTTPVNEPTAQVQRTGVMLPPSGVPRLVCVGGSQKDRSFPVTADGITVGRDPDNVIVITDARASHHHAWIGIVDRLVILRDLGSTNGTFLNARIDSPVSEIALSPGDTIFFGGHGRDQFRFVVD
jgi:type II secretory pathway pseudopilin PulG